MAIQLDPRNTTDTAAPSVQRQSASQPYVVTDPDTATVPAVEHHRLHGLRAWLHRVPLPGISKPNVALAGLQLLVGYEWLVSGVDKVLLGAFPAAMPGLLNGAISGGRIPGFFAALLQNVVLPYASFFAVFIEWAELLAGLGLMAAGLVTLLRPLAERYLKLRAALVYSYGAHLLDLLAPVAAIGAGVLGLSFFLLDGLPTPWFSPSIAYGGAIDTGLFLAVASVVLVAGQLLPRHRA